MSGSMHQWRAEFEGSILHIVGSAKFPNSFSTAGLERMKEEEPECLSYRLVFHRDKEPFCDADGIGPVHHFERHVPISTKIIRVLVDGRSEVFPVTR